MLERIDIRVLLVNSTIPQRRHRPSAICKLLDWHIHRIKHRHKQIRQRHFLLADKLVQLAMLEAKLITTGQLDRIVVRAM